jgi:hypothetical protein
MSVTCSANPLVVYIIWRIYDEEYILWSTSSWDFLHSCQVQIFSSEPSSQKLLICVFRVICQVSHPYKTTGKIIRLRWGPGIFLFTTASRPALGPIQPPIQWVAGALSLGVKRPGREADHSPPSRAEVKECVELYLHSPIRLHGVVLS